MTTPASHRSVAAGPSSLGEPDGSQQTDTRFSAVESTPTYRLVFESIERAILEGRLRLGDRLPTETAEALAAGDEAVRPRYEAAMQALLPKFSLYEKAAHVNHRPWLADLVIWRARKSERIRRRMSGVLEETQNPGRLLSWRGLTKLMFE